MNPFRLMTPTAALLSACLLAGACTSQELEIRQPDGTVQVYRNVSFHPHLNVRPDQITLRDAGTTDDGFPVVQITRNDGKGGVVFKVTPPDGEPLYFERVPLSKGAGRPTPTRAPVVTDEPPRARPKSGEVKALRVEADLSIDRGVLLGLSADGDWQPLASGPLGSLARVGAEHGLFPLEIDNAFGHWRLTADRRFPMVTVRCNGSIVQVRAMP